MKRYVIIAVFFMLAVIKTSSSQEWFNTYNGTSNSEDKGYGIVVDGDNVYTAGFVTNDTTGNDIILIKYTISGGHQWVKTYRGINGNYEDRSWGIAVDNIGNIVVIGYTTSTGSNIDYVTIKYNSSGTLLWSKTYNGTDNGEDRAWGIVIDDNNNIYVTGTSRGSNGYDDCVTINYISSGSESWVKRYNGNAGKNDGGTAIAMDDDDNIYVAGYTVYDGTDADYLLIRYTTEGTEEWDKHYDGTGSGEDKAWGITVDNNSNDNNNAYIFITGYSLASATKIDAVTIKYNTSGSVQWTSRYNSPENNDERGLGIVVDSRTNSVYVRGTTLTSSHGLDFLTLRYNATNGNLHWARAFDGTGNSDDTPNCMTLSVGEDAFVMIAGITRSSNSQQSEDIAVLSYDAEGNVLETDIYGGEANLADGAFGIAVDSRDNYYIAGYMGVQGNENSSAPSSDMLTAKYQKITVIGIIKTSGQIPGDYRLYQNYPNPFNPSTTIKFDISKAADVKISVYDITGKEIETLLNNYLTAGTYEVSFNNISLSSGVYFYRLTTGSYSEIKKMTLVK